MKLRRSAQRPPAAPPDAAPADGAGAPVQVRPRPTSFAARLGERIEDTFHAPPCSAAWSRRVAQMARDKEYAETPEVQVAAYYFDVRIRVFINNGRGEYVMNFIGNPLGKRGGVDLVLRGMHYGLVTRPIEGERFPADGNIAATVARAPQDGNCFFHCVAHGVASAPKSAHAVRALVARRLRGAEHMKLDGTPELTLGQACGQG